jgi:hypothetical protein
MGTMYVHGIVVQLNLGSTSDDDVFGILTPI